MLRKTGLNNYKQKAVERTHLYIRHPEQANVEHTVSEESSQVESEEIKTEAYHTASNKTHRLFISFFIQSKSSSLKDNLAPSSFPVIIRLWVERHRPGRKVNPAMIWLMMKRTLLLTIRNLTRVSKLERQNPF